MWFVQPDFGGSNSVLVTRMDNELSPTPTFTNFSLPVNSYVQPPRNVPQPGGYVETIDSRTLNVEWNNNNLVAAFNAASGADATATWIEKHAPHRKMKNCFEEVRRSVVLPQTKLALQPQDRR